MRILAIETSCDETGVAIVEDGRRIPQFLHAIQHKIGRQKHVHAIYRLHHRAPEIRVDFVGALHGIEKTVGRFDLQNKREIPGERIQIH